MALKLRQSTSRIVRIGPFVDVSDGATPEAGITLGTADEAEILKAGGGASVSIAGNTWAAVTGSDGWYDLTLTAANTDTVGDLVVVVQDLSVCLPVFAEFQVVEEAVYDELYAASAAGYATQASVDTVDANVDLILADTGELQTDWADGGRLDLILDARAAEASLPSNFSILSISPGTGIVDADVVRLNGNASTPPRLQQWLTSWDSGTIQSDSGTTVRLDAGNSSVNDFYKGDLIFVYGGTGAGQSRRIVAYNGTTKDATLINAFATSLSTDSTYLIVPDGTTNVEAISGDATAADNLEAAFDGTGYDLGGIDVSVLNTAATAIGSDGSGLTVLATQASVNTIDSNVDLILADTGTDGVVLSSATQNAIADAILTRNVSNVEGSAAEHTLCTVILASLEFSVSGSTLTIKRTDGSTTHATKTITTAAGDPITAIT